MYKFFNFLQLKRKKVIKGHNLVIYGPLFLHGHGQISLGNNVVLISSSFYNATAGFSELHFSTKEQGVLEIGNNVGISNSAITAALYVSIGDDVLIGSGCMISDTDHHELLSTDRKNKKGNIKMSPIVISKGVFIGARSIILKGSHIGENTVIGAGSVVSGNIPANEIWAGNPARFIRKNSNTEYDEQQPSGANPEELTND